MGAIIYSSDVETNKITDFYHASAIENKEFKNLENKSKKKITKENTKENKDASEKTVKVENIKTGNTEDKKIQKNCNKNNSTVEVENIIRNNIKKNKKQDIKKIANIIQECKKNFSGYNLDGYECIDVLNGDATFYTATGNPMSNGEFPVAGKHCAMHSKFLTPKSKKNKDKIITLAEITFANGETIWREVGDTGGALNEGRAIVDIYCNTRDECIQNGRKKGTTVKVWRTKSKN